jgi:hypothetical protein
LQTTKSTYELIGELSVEFNNLEFFSAYLFSSFGISSKSGFQVLHEDGIKKSIDKIISYSKEKIKDKNKQIQTIEFCNSIHEVREKRNDIMHSIINESNGIQEIISLSESYKMQKFIGHEIIHKDIEETIGMIQELNIKIIYIIMNIRKLIKEGN